MDSAARERGKSARTWAGGVSVAVQGGRAGSGRGAYRLEDLGRFVVAGGAGHGRVSGERGVGAGSDGAAVADTHRPSLMAPYT